MIRGGVLDDSFVVTASDGPASAAGILPIAGSCAADAASDSR